MAVYIYDATTIDAFSWPETDEGRKAKNFLMPLIKENIKDYISNVSTTMYLVVCNDLFLPITINETQYSNSYIASNYYGICFYNEKMSEKHPIFLRFQKPFLSLGKWFLKKIGINRCIFLNNWLMTNNISSPVSFQDFQKIVHFLQERFPKHVIIYRNIDSCLQQALIDVLKKSHFHVLKTREVFLYDPSKKEELSTKAQSHHRKDRKILDKYHYSIVRTFTESEIQDMLTLYRKVYITKHTSYSPHYKEKFLKNALEHNIFSFLGLKREGRLEGIMGFFTKNKTMITSFFGYDTNLAHSGELYRLLTILILEEAEKEGVILNDSSGGEKTKSYRGLVPFPEFMGIYNRHLPFANRFFWDSLSFVYHLITRPTRKR